MSKNRKQGSVVYPGIVQGNASVVRIKQDIQKLPSGSIVVGRVFELDDLMLLKTKKISSLVSEEGGMTSHIAITGREFKIPSIMGVKGVTKFLKDACPPKPWRRRRDLVEVDADKGVVKILKRA